MKYWASKQRGIVFLSLHHKDDVLESIHTLIKEADLQNAIVMTGLGSLTKGHFHIIASNNYPPGDTFIKLDGPWRWRRSPASSPTASPTSTSRSWTRT